MADGEEPGDSNGSMDNDTPYVFDPADVPIAVSIAETAFTTLDFGWGTVPRVRRAAAAAGIAGSPLEAELVHAAGHQLHRAINGRPRCELGRSELAEFLDWPRPVAQTPSEVVHLWREVAVQVTEPAAIARFEDLLFAVHDGNGGERVRRATAGYLSAVDAAGTIDMDEVDALVRVWTLGRAIRDADIDDDVRQRMVDVAAEVMQSSPGERPGVSLGMLHPLSVGPLRVGADPHDVDAMLTLASGMYTADHLAAQIAAMRRSRAGGDQAKLDEIARDEVEAYFTQADVPGVHAAVRMHHLNNAARVATQRGLPDMARRATALMQQIKPSELGMARIRVEQPLPPEVPETVRAPFTKGPSWRDGLAHFFAGGPPSGSIEQIRDLEQTSRGSFVRLFPTTVFGAGGMPRTSTQSDDDAQAHDMSRVAALGAQNMGRWLAQGLDRMSLVYDLPTVDELTSAIVSFGCADPHLARSLAKGFRYFWDRDYEAAVAVLVPKFEAAARSLLRELDEGIYRVQVAKDPGGYVGLYVLLDELEKIALDESWAYFFRWLLLGPYGANLRNDIAHGFVFDPGPTFAALTLRAVSVLSIVAGPLPDDSYDPQSDSAPSSTRSRVDVLAKLQEPTGPSTRVERMIGAFADHLERLTWRTRIWRYQRAAARRATSRPSG